MFDRPFWGKDTTRIELFETKKYLVFSTIDRQDFQHIIIAPK